MAQNFFTSSVWSLVKEETPQETLGLEKVPQYVYFDIHGAEIAELRERVKKLEERLEQKSEQQFIPIQFLDSEKLELKQPLCVTLNYSSDSEEWVADCLELNIYGSGRDEAEAIKDFKIALEESYFSLKKDKDKLAPQLEEEWKYLNRVIKEK